MSRFLDPLRKLYPRPAWAVFAEVCSATGDRQGGRRADYLAVNVQPSGKGQVILFEEKASRSDLRREVKAPEKSEEIGQYATQKFLVVPAPWKLIFLSERMIPRGWGLLEIGGGSVVEVVEAPKTSAVPMSEGFMMSLIRAGDVQGTAVEGPESVITRPNLSRSHVGLGCGHIAPMPLCKARDMPKKLPCLACAAGDPTDNEIVEAVLDDADPEQLEKWLQVIAGKLGRDAA
jgi:hypothetical protein